MRECVNFFPEMAGNRIRSSGISGVFQYPSRPHSGRRARPGRFPIRALDERRFENLSAPKTRKTREKGGERFPSRKDRRDRRGRAASESGEKPAF